MSDVTLKAIEEMGFKTMTEIQAKSIPPALEGKDLRGTAKTGAGKTLAFSLPVVELLSKLQFKPRNGKRDRYVLVRTVITMMQPIQLTKSPSHRS